MPVSSNAFGSVRVCDVIDAINALPEDGRRAVINQLKIAAPEVPWCVDRRGRADTVYASFAMTAWE